MQYEIGNLGEEIAFEYLKKKGYIIKERNFKRKWGEIDIVAIDKKTKEIVFVEVKTRQCDISEIKPEEEFTIKKQHKLKRIILGYLGAKNLGEKNGALIF